MTRVLFSVWIVLSLSGLRAHAQNNAAGLLTGVGIVPVIEYDGWAAARPDRTVWVNSAYYRRQIGKRWAAKLEVSHYGWNDSVADLSYDYGAYYFQQTRCTTLNLTGAYKLLRARNNNAGGLWVGAGMGLMETNLLQNGGYYSGWYGSGELRNARTNRNAWMGTVQVDYAKALYRSLLLELQFRYTEKLRKDPITPSEPLRSFSLQCGLGFAF